MAEQYKEQRGLFRGCFTNFENLNQASRKDKAEELGVLRYQEDIVAHSDYNYRMRPKSSRCVKDHVLVHMVIDPSPKVLHQAHQIVERLSLAPIVNVKTLHIS